MELLPVLSAWQWALVAVVPPAIVALYFLKLRRQPLEVPSTFLWHKSIEDLHVNSLWQRIRQSLLLYLQLLLLLLVICALLRPGWHGTKQIEDRNILLIDNSASMSATDVAPSRLAEAKRRALAIIDNMQTEDEREETKHQLGTQSSALVEKGSPYKAMVVSFSDTARVEQGWTNNPRELRAAIENIQPTNRTTSIDEALRVAAGLANTSRSAENSDDKSLEAPPAKLFIFSDGKFPPVHNVSLGRLEPVFIPIGQSDAANVGIISFSVRRNEERENELQAFGNIENFCDEKVTVPVDLLLNGNSIDTSEVEVKPGETTGVSFNLGDVDSGVLELRLSRDDALLVDNSAWAAINAARRPKVLLITPGNEALVLAVLTPRASELADVSKAAPSVLETKEYQQAAGLGTYDLIIYDRCQPKEMPHASTLFIGAEPSPPGRGQGEGAEPHANPPHPGPLPEGEGENVVAKSKSWSLDTPVVFPQIIDVDRTHPLTQWLDLGDVDIAEARPVTPPSGGTRLIDSNKGTLFAIAPREGFEDAVLGFVIYTQDKNSDRTPNTNWPIRRSFPTFVYAVLSYLVGGGANQAGESVKPGQSINIKTELAADQMTVQTPSGAKRIAVRNKNGSCTFSETGEPGPYQVQDGLKTVQWFTVNLCDEPESNIALTNESSIRIGNLTVQASPVLEPVRRETWKWLLAAALAVLLLEWYIYNRRVYV